ncbi:DUF2855 family protein [Thalassotalea euphylliae]|uniref:DUF2855 family protein n=1 Tax=Thalassotalea euphylliae TaxID=1655234 RepID=UPI003630B37E
MEKVFNSQAREYDVFEVAKKSLNETRVCTSVFDWPLAAGQVLLQVDKFALTANNVTYGITGDMLGYWRFFPTNKGWGRLPVMGFADVVASNHDDISVGERVYGFFPMGKYLTINAGRVSVSGFFDTSEHRQGLSPVYARFERVAANPFYQKGTEDYQMLVKGLYTTSWLIDDFMFDNNFFGADQYLITSASSKTSIALAFCVKQRGLKPSVGITSKSRVDYVKSLGVYDNVIDYDDIASLDANTPSIVVDMAGSNTVLSNIHQLFAGNLKFSSRVGATHINDLYFEGELVGPKPINFFAPHQVEKRSNEWGSEKLMVNIAQMLNPFIAFCFAHIDIEGISDMNTLERHYQSILLGKQDAKQGLIVTL